MVYERYTEKAKRVVYFARQEASQTGNPFIETEHLLLGLLKEDEALCNRLAQSPLPPDAIRKRIEEQARSRESVSSIGDPQLSWESKRILAYAAQGADRLRDKHIGTEHLLLGVASERGGFAAKLLSKAGIKGSDFHNIIGRVRIPPWAKAKIEDYVEIHDKLWSNKSVRDVSEFYQKFHWEKRQWVARDALVQRSNRKLQLYAGQSYDPEKFELVQGAWSEDHCAICWWALCESDSPEHGEGLTNGQDWVCTECYERFLGPKRPPDL
ncbi:MAG: Clp protease N-terminal domain-containing protein [Terriglobia bacterium]